MLQSCASKSNSTVIRKIPQHSQQHSQQHFKDHKPYTCKHVLKWLTSILIGIQLHVLIPSAVDKAPGLGIFSNTLATVCYTCLQYPNQFHKPFKIYSAYLVSTGPTGSSDKTFIENKNSYLRLSKQRASISCYLKIFGGFLLNTLIKMMYNL